MLRLSGTLISFNSTLVQLKASNMLEDNQFYLGFNSTLVQLKEIRKHFTELENERFNSTLVQLKVVQGMSLVIILLLFQFYLSSIKRHSTDYSSEQFPSFQFYLSSIKRF